MTVVHSETQLIGVRPTIEFYRFSTRRTHRFSRSTSGPSPKNPARAPSWTVGRLLHIARPTKRHQDDGDLALKRILGCAFKVEWTNRA